MNLIHQKIIYLKAQLQNLPDGNLICAKNGENGRYSKWYVNAGSGYQYLPKKQRPLAESLALRKYYTLQLAKLTKELELLDSYETFRETNPYSKDLTQFLSEGSPYFELIKNSLHDSYNASDLARAWLSETYTKNQSFPEHLLHKSLSGEKLRSKSEVIIANALYMNHIPYRYECELVLGDVSLHPDFTILHPTTFEIYYWEHFGMMHSPSYRETTFQKLKLYGEHQIYPMEHLITTYESDSLPLDSERIQQIIEQYFL